MAVCCVLYMSLLCWILLENWKCASKQQQKLRILVFHLCLIDSYSFFLSISNTPNNKKFTSSSKQQKIREMQILCVFCWHYPRWHNNIFSPEHIFFVIWKTWIFAIWNCTIWVSSFVMRWSWDRFVGNLVTS